MTTTNNHLSLAYAGAGGGSACWVRWREITIGHFNRSAQLDAEMRAELTEQCEHLERLECSGRAGRSNGDSCMSYTIINSNGSKWYGDEQDSIETLIEVLGKHPLDRGFEAYGNFIAVDPPLIKGDNMRGTNFFGNFLTVSHVFNIDTDDPEVIRKLTAAIRENQKRPDYREQEKPKRREYSRVHQLRRDRGQYENH